MKCPNCPETLLVLTERQSVEIDYCPQCRGVWLDRGELDKLVARSNEPRPQRGFAASGTDLDGPDRPGGYSKFSQSQPRRKKSWLGEIFD